MIQSIIFSNREVQKTHEGNKLAQIRAKSRFMDAATAIPALHCGLRGEWAFVTTDDRLSASFALAMKLDPLLLRFGVLRTKQNGFWWRPERLEESDMPFRGACSREGHLTCYSNNPEYSVFKYLTHNGQKKTIKHIKDMICYGIFYQHVASTFCTCAVKI